MYYTHNIDPTILHLGPLEIRWYGLFYLIGFVVGYFILKKRYQKGYTNITPLQVQDLITYLMVGMMIGARITYALVYNWDYYSNHLIEVFYIWKGGLSFHGAALGFAAGIYFYSRKYKFPFWHIADNVCLVGACGVFIGRWGNWTNGELWGRITDVPWGVIFPAAGPEPRHPSQLYQSLGEGLCVFLILLLLDKMERRKHFRIEESKKGKEIKAKWDRIGLMSGVFLIGYGIARFIVEFYRQPDAQLGYYFNYFSMGQILCALMIIVGLVILIRRMKKPISYEYKRSIAK
ncbi:MAG: prolipoprotein diacylglyceryl transferase [Bdellovibrionota bacterium]|nr:prolipoprotein diacylglyceryl transferase [Pseudobdellovibrionaceae bacterium]|tara:strand:- start:23935 stop:24804 length:870 start_codon:yes stop_codon:yes gene_type:complete